MLDERRRRRQVSRTRAGPSRVSGTARSTVAPAIYRNIIVIPCCFTKSAGAYGSKLITFIRPARPAGHVDPSEEQERV